ncbi:DUF305 domain-containing protein [Frigidibacter sp. MR17.24]|uniref:DUF305 domain-containing protein n=1 Tax=Frigidibacter sp. MR17.24 TaxID=3127345 RepID=UPI00301310E1
MSYLRFSLMILASTLVMFGLMYLNTYAVEHVFFSETRAWMALVMGAAMAPVMLGFMWGMYRGRGAKLAVLGVAALVFAGALWLVRSQATVDGTSYMRAMIPHHSIAIMTSERAGITDPRVRKLADGIIEAQEREIAEMRYLLADIARGGRVEAIYHDPAPRPGTVAEALAAARLAGLDPAQMTEDEIARVVAAPRCRFRQTAAAPAILAVGAEGAGLLVNGVLVRLAPESEPESPTEGMTEGATAWVAEGLRVEVTPEADPGPRANAEMVFALTDGPRIGYRGFWACDG